MSNNLDFANDEAAKLPSPSCKGMADAALLAELARADSDYDRMVELLAEFDRRQLVTIRP